MNLTATLISLAVGVVIPALVALITKASVSNGLKALLTGMLSALSGALSGALTSPPHGVGQWEQIVLSVAIAWAAAGISYLTGWAPSGAEAAISARTSGFGFG